MTFVRKQLVTAAALNQAFAAKAAEANLAALLARVDAVMADAPSLLDTFDEVDAAIALLAPLTNPHLLGTPTAPTGTQGQNTTQIATQAFVVAAINALVNSAPGTLDTLAEIAAALQADESAASALATTVAGKLAKASNLSDLPDAGAALTNLGGTAIGKAIFAIASYAALRTAMGLGSAATLDAGTAVGNLVQVITGGKLPVLDGSNLTNLPAASGVTAAQITDASANGRSLITALNYAAMRTELSLGTAALLDVGTTADKVVQLTSAAKLPAVDGSLLTNISAGKLVSRAYAEYATATNVTTLIPYDNTIPQSNEGVEVMTAVITPSNSANRIRCMFSGSGHSTGSYPNFAIAMFKTGSTDAIISKNIAAQYSGGAVDVTLITEFVAGVTTPITISIRVGAYYNGGMNLNGYGGSYKEHGASQKCTLIVEEITP